MSSRLTGAYKIRPYEQSILLKDRFIFEYLSNLTFVKTGKKVEIAYVFFRRTRHALSLQPFISLRLM